MGVPGITIVSANKKHQTSKETFPMSDLDIFVQVIGRCEAPETNKLAESFRETRPVQMLCNLFPSLKPVPLAWAEELNIHGAFSDSQGCTMQMPSSSLSKPLGSFPLPL